MQAARTSLISRASAGRKKSTSRPQKQVQAAGKDAGNRANADSKANAGRRNKCRQQEQVQTAGTRNGSRASVGSRVKAGCRIKCNIRSQGKIRPQSK
tara:strand:- start:111 stop:401 length:291 start_codon:yes stop_codon:yes gene_type:complete